MAPAPQSKIESFVETSLAILLLGCLLAYLFTVVRDFRARGLSIRPEAAEEDNLSDAGSYEGEDFHVE